MNTCCELGTRLYSENKLVNKENTVFLLSRHTVTAGPMDPSPSPCSVCLSGADAHRQHLPGSHIAGLPSVPPQRSTGGRSEGQRSEDHLCALSVTSLQRFPLLPSGHSQQGPMGDHGLMGASFACFQVSSGYPGCWDLTASCFPFVHQHSSRC